MSDQYEQFALDLAHLDEDCPGIGKCEKCEDLIHRMHTLTPPAPPTTDPTKSFTCPDCKRTSFHPADVINAYCGACHAFKNDDWMAPRCMEPRCPDFGDYDFGEGTCPADHAIPPGRRR